MRRVLGFGKNYFTLAAIQAYSAQAVRLRAERAFLDVSLGVRRFADRADEEEQPPPDTPVCSFSSLNANPCHCNCFFRRRAWLLLHLSRLRKRPACRCRYTKTGLAPPF